VSITMWTVISEEAKSAPWSWIPLGPSGSGPSWSDDASRQYPEVPLPGPWTVTSLGKYPAHVGSEVWQSLPS